MVEWYVTYENHRSRRSGEPSGTFPGPIQPPEGEDWALDSWKVVVASPTLNDIYFLWRREQEPKNPYR